MEKLNRRVALVALMLPLMGCSSGGGQEEGPGKLNLPLASQGPGGVKYRLRNARFIIQRSGYAWLSGATAGTSAGGSGGSGTAGSAGSSSGGSGPVAGAAGSGGGTLLIVDSDDHLDDDSVSVSLEEGEYYVYLQPSWYLEKISPEGTTTVEATLLSSQSVYIYVYRQSTTWATFEFGLGERSLWLNGELNLNINVYEHAPGPTGGSGPIYPAGGAAGIGGGGGGWQGGAGGGSP